MTVTDAWRRIHEGDKARMRPGIREAYDRLLDEVQASIVVVGGRKFTPEELEELPFGELLGMLLRNGVAVGVSVFPGQVERNLSQLKHAMKRAAADEDEDDPADEGDPGYQQVTRTHCLTVSGPSGG